MILTKGLSPLFKNSKSALFISHISNSNYYKLIKLIFPTLLLSFIYPYHGLIKLFLQKLVGGKLMLNKISILTAFLIFVPGMLFAQVPDHFTNLTVLPKTISKEELIGVMRSFTEGLGVRCGFCHVEEEGQSPHKFDFSSDDKDNKKKARIMMKMTQNINENYLSELKDFGGGNVIKVRCITCHHGLKEPKTLAQELNGVIKRKGIEDAVSTYHDLYKQYYGGFAYNFEANSLAELTHMLIEEKNYDAAIKISNLNVEQYPNSGLAYFSLGEAYEASGDKAKATENVKKAVELSPKNGWFNKKLQELQSQ